MTMKYLHGMLPKELKFSDMLLGLKVITCTFRGDSIIKINCLEMAKFKNMICINFLQSILN